MPDRDRFFGACTSCQQPVWGLAGAHRKDDSVLCAVCDPLAPKRRDADGIDSYYEQIKRYPLLNAKEETALATKVRAGDEKAREQFICSNLRLVIKVAHEFRVDFLALEDRVAEGNLGLIEAVNRFDPTKGFRFSTYATFWIKHKICLALCKYARSYRIPPAVYNKLVAFRSALADYRSRDVELPPDEELAEELGIPTAHVDRYHALNTAREFSLNDEAMTQGEDAPGHIPCENTLPPSSLAAHANVKAELSAALIILTPRERKMIKARFPIDHTTPQKRIVELAQEFGMSLESIRKILNSALVKLKDYMSDKRRIASAGDILPD